MEAIILEIIYKDLLNLMSMQKELKKKDLNQLSIIQIILLSANKLPSL